MQKLKDAIARVAPIPSPVLVIGESGSGKELVARDIHRLSGRVKEPFVAMNCAALPENLVESELFGHERGAFTGAHATRKGAFESAGKGTLFLDEIGELPLPAQAKLLRVLEERAVVRLGATRGVDVPARVVRRRTEPRRRRGREDVSGRICCSGSTCTCSACRRCAIGCRTSRSSPSISWRPSATSSASGGRRSRRRRSSCSRATTGRATTCASCATSWSGW